MKRLNSRRMIVIVCERFQSFQRKISEVFAQKLSSLIGRAQFILSNVKLFFKNIESGVSSPFISGRFPATLKCVHRMNCT